MVDPERLPLARLVEVDETSLPQRMEDDSPASCHGRSGKGRMPVVAAVEVEDRRPGWLRLAALADYSATSLHAFIARSIDPNATIKTDAWQGYPGAPVAGHDPRTVGAMAAHVVRPWSHRVFNDLERRALGTDHGPLRQHLQADPASARKAGPGARRARLPLQSPPRPPGPFHRLLGLATLLPHASYQMSIERS